MKKLLFTTLIFPTLFVSCRFFDGKRIKGNGVIKTESRTVDSFSGIRVSGNADVYVKQDSIYSVKVETDENLLPYLLTTNSNGSLDIHQKEGTNLNPSKTIKVYVSCPSFKRFDASGACDFFSENRIVSNEPVHIQLSGSSDVKMDIKAPGISADLSGEGTIALRGESKNFTVSGSGSTDVKCFDLLAENTEVNISGAGDAEVFASVKLDVQVSGSGDVKYKGNATVNQSISGAGSVKKVE